MVTKEWVSIHRKHHRYSDVDGDPHSPHVFGIKNIFFRGVYYYHLEAKNTEVLETYGRGTPDDIIERKLYTPHSKLGILLLLLIDVLLFGYWGLLVWGIQMLWIPFWAAGVINGLAHWWGYRNGQTRDRSRNILPFGIIIGGEELHNNHHLNAASAKLSLKPWEFDIGWMYITLLGYAGLAKLKSK
jgi:stearoyl-CoA desaturase (delta-9 desaturase)